MGESLLYVLLWTSIFLVPVLNSAMTSREDLYLYEIIEAWCKIFPYFFIFAVNNFVVIPRFLLRKRYDLYLFFDIIIIVAVFLFVDYAQNHLLTPLHDMAQMANSRSDGEVSFTDLNIFWNCLFALFMNAGNAGISLVYKSIREERKMEELTRQNMQVEMDYLKYQINPHFFMNTLNNIHALIDIDSESAKRTVIELSKMMRYVLYESGSESISLRRDLQFVGNYIELMRIRYDNDIDVRFNYSEGMPIDSSIPPLLLIVFVENAFKHGVVGGDEGSYIDINIDFSDGRLCCVVENSMPKDLEGKSTSGIGLFNVRRRLELLFGDDFRLDTEQRVDSYYVRLEIPVVS